MATGKDLLLKLANEVNLLKQQVASQSERIKKLEAAGDGDAWLDEEVESAPAWDDPAAHMQAYRDFQATLEVEDDDPRVAEARARLAKDKPGQHIAPPANDTAVIATEGVDSTEIELPTPTAEDELLRFAFAKNVLQLDAVWPDTDACETYAKGGPMWLYLQEAGRDYILQCPVDWRVAMVEDAARFSQTDAQELGRDILKDANPGDAQGAMDRLYGKNTVNLG